MSLSHIAHLINIYKRHEPQHLDLGRAGAVGAGGACSVRGPPPTGVKGRAGAAAGIIVQYTINIIQYTTIFNMLDSYDVL